MLILTSACEDIPRAPQVQNVLQDIVDIRHGKIRQGLHGLSIGIAPAVKVCAHSLCADMHSHMRTSSTAYRRWS